MRIDLEVVTAMGALATPLVVLAIGYMLSRKQSRSEGLLSARFEYYEALAPQLNTLMCYMTFIGDWSKHSPVEIVELKRRLDRQLYCALPLFSAPVGDAYRSFMNSCFKTFNAWGKEPLILTNAYRRRQVWKAGTGWNPQWDDMFMKSDSEAIHADELMSIRSGHDALIAAIVRDLDMTRARGQYTSGSIVLTAHAPTQEDLEGITSRSGATSPGTDASSG
jgi:hypothetical protein